MELTSTKKAFGLTVPRAGRENRSAVGAAIAMMAASEQTLPNVQPRIPTPSPIPIGRARDLRQQHLAQSASELEIKARLSRQIATAERAEKRVQKAIENARQTVIQISDQVTLRLRRIAKHERRLSSQHHQLEKLLEELRILEREEQALNRARTALEALRQHMSQPKLTERLG